jgi:trk system potassium uptake protein TrkA
MANGGVDVIAVDQDLRLVERMKDDVSLAVCLDAAEEDALRQHGIPEADVLLAAIGRNFEAQVLVVLYARNLGIPKIIARATTPDHARILKALGVAEVVKPEEEAARLIVQRLMIPNITSYFELADCFSVIEIKAPPAVVGKTLRELDLRRKHRINLVAIKRLTYDKDGNPNGAALNPVPEPDESILASDELALVGSDLDLANFIAKMS